MDYAPAEQKNGTGLNGALEFTWIIVGWDIIVIVPMILLWYFGRITLDGDIVPRLAPGRRRRHRIRLTPEERERRIDPRPPRPMPPRELAPAAWPELEEEVARDYAVMTRNFALREARRLARRERRRRFNARVQAGVAGVRSTFGAVAGRGRERREGETQTQTDSGAGAAWSVLAVRGSREQQQQQRRQQPQSQSPQDRNLGVDQEVIELQPPHLPRELMTNNNRPLPPLPRE